MMQSIKVTILGKQIPLKVKESEVEITRQIAHYVDEKFRTYKNQLTNQPDSTIMILASLSITEELFELKNNVQGAENSGKELMDQVNKQLEQLVEEIS